MNDDFFHMFFGRPVKTIKKPMKSFTQTFNNEFTYSDCFFAIKKDVFIINNIPYTKKQVSRKLKNKLLDDGLDIDILEISSPFIIVRGGFTPQDFHEVTKLDEEYNSIKEIPGTNNFYIIDLSNFGKSAQLNEALLDIIHEIGVKYINGEPLSDDYITNNISILQSMLDVWLHSEGIDAECLIDIEDHNIAIAFSKMVDKEEIFNSIGLDKEIFIEVSTLSETVFVCSCPRVVFEEFFDKQENNNSEGANKWII